MGWAEDNSKKIQLVLQLEYGLRGDPLGLDFILRLQGPIKGLEQESDRDQS